MKMKKHPTIDPDNPPLTNEQLRAMRPATTDEVDRGRRAIENTLGVCRPPRVGRPTKYASGKLAGVYIRLHPQVLEWARREARKRHVGYQTFLSEWLLHDAQAA
jgi:hypothetical protein